MFSGDYIQPCDGREESSDPLVRLMGEAAARYFGGAQGGVGRARPAVSDRLRPTWRESAKVRKLYVHAETDRAETSSGFAGTSFALHRRVPNPLDKRLESVQQSNDGVQQSRGVS